MSIFNHLNLYGRQRIEKYLKVQKSRRFIAEKLDRSVSSISDSLEHFAEVERKLRERFMKCLNYKKPREAFEKEIQKQKRLCRCGMIVGNVLLEKVN